MNSNEVYFLAGVILICFGHWIVGTILILMAL